MDVIQELQAARDAIADLRSAKADLEQKLGKALEREKLLARLAELESTSPVTESAPDHSADGRPLAEHEIMVNAVEELLRDLDRPSHISEIRRRLIERGVPIPGMGVDANIIVHIRKDPRFLPVSGQRGVYDLRARANGAVTR